MPAKTMMLFRNQGISVFHDRKMTEISLFPHLEIELRVCVGISLSIFLSLSLSQFHLRVTGKQMEIVMRRKRPSREQR
jgi:hypothetical protein